MNKIQKPNFIIIGAMKAATTSLYQHLKEHPDIFMSSIKEPMFFNNLNKNKGVILKGSKKRKIKDFTEYYNLFNTVKNETAIGEASPSYIYNKDCAYLIKKNLDNVKIIAILRQPVERAYSNYLHTRRAGREPIDNFEDAFNNEDSRIAKNWSPLYHYKSQGYYYEQLNRYYKLFPRKNIKIILFETLTKNTKSSVKEIFKFLNVKSDFDIKSNKKSNISGIPKGILGWFMMKLRYYNLIPNIEFSKYFPNFIIHLILNSIYTQPKKIDRKTVLRLTNKHYKKDIKKLEQLIGKNLESWLI